MLKKMDERLVWLNGENYDQQWHWNDNKEMEKDIIDYFGLNTDDNFELNMFFRKVEWDGAGEYVFSEMQGRFIPLELAVNEEFNGSGLMNLEHYKAEQQREILDYIYSTEEALAKEKYLELLDELDPNSYNGLCCDTYMQRQVLQINNQEEYNKILIEAMKYHSSSEEETDEEIIENLYDDYKNNFNGVGLYDFWLGNDVNCSTMYTLNKAIEELKEMTLENMNRNDYFEPDDMPL